MCLLLSPPCHPCQGALEGPPRDLLPVSWRGSPVFTFVHLSLPHASLEENTALLILPARKPRHRMVTDLWGSPDWSGWLRPTAGTMFSRWIMGAPLCVEPPGHREAKWPPS